MTHDLDTIGSFDRQSEVPIGLRVLVSGHGFCDWTGTVIGKLPDDAMVLMEHCATCACYEPHPARGFWRVTRDDTWISNEDPLGQWYVAQKPRNPQDKNPVLLVHPYRVHLEPET